MSSFYTGRQSFIMILCAIVSTVLMFTVPFAPTLTKKIIHLKNKLIFSVRYFIKTKYKLKKLVTSSRFAWLHQTIGKFPEKLSHNEIVFDCFFLIFIVLASAVLYIQQIGFYSDDWAFLGNFSLAKDQSLLGLFDVAITPNTLMRPMQNFYDALLFWLFRTEPFGYQLVNTGVLTTSTVLFYFVLRKIKTPRIIALVVPLIYALLPHYSADRFWYAAFQTNLSIMFYFISLLSALIALPHNQKYRISLKVVSLVFLILSVLSYEVVLPLYLVNAFLIWNPFERLDIRYAKKHMIKQNHLIFLSMIFITILYLLAFKAITTVRLESNYDPFYIISVVKSAFWVNYGVLGINLPTIIGNLISLYATPLMLVFAGIIYFVTFGYLYFVVSRPNSVFPSASWSASLSLISIVIFIFGYMIFFTNSQVGFSPTGIENRVAVAASIGVAFSFVGIIGFFSRLLLPANLAKIFFCLVISLACSGCFLVVNSLALFWGGAYDQGQAVLSAVHKEFPKFPKNSTLIVDGICPYYGPAPVFEADWDITGALQTHYKDPTLRADIVTTRLKIKENGLQTQIYTFPSNYAYKNLYIYNYDYGSVHRLTDSDSAKEYFQTYNADMSSGCPHGSPGKGVDIIGGI